MKNKESILLQLSPSPRLCLYVSATRHSYRATLETSLRLSEYVGLFTKVKLAVEE